MIDDDNKCNECENNIYKNLICICCPRGCHLKVNLNENKVLGNSCKRGESYGITELTNPIRIVTTTLKVKGGEQNIVPVKTKSAIPKDLTFKCIEILKEMEIKAPISVGDVLYKNILETGIDIVACRNIRKSKSLI